MHRALILILAALTAAPAAAQTVAPAADSSLTQALLLEIRGLRQDLMNMAAAIQRVQIVMYRVQAETALLARASERFDIARTRCNQIKSQRDSLPAEIANTEERARNAQNPTERQAAEALLPRLKGQVDFLANEEAQCRGKEAEAESQFRAEQARMNELQDQFDKLDKALGGVR